MSQASDGMKLAAYSAGTEAAPRTESTTVAEARRQMEICNACRYCEGYCAVFPAMAMRRAFSEGDLTHLANLCHNCKGCFHSCQYAPPHPFGVNIPATFATIRQESYAEYAVPRAMGRLFERNGTVVAGISALALTLVLLLVVALQDPSVLWSAQTGTGAFFRVIPYTVMVNLASLTFGWAIVAMILSSWRYWRGTAPRSRLPLSGPAVAEATMDVVLLRNLGGGGHGCNDLDDGFAQKRRWLHQAMAGGFLLCFAATSVGTVYHHILGWFSPHPFWSLPVQLGTWGGVLLCIGAAGLLYVKAVTDPAPVARRLLGGEVAMLALLFLIGATGLLLLAVRHTGAMGITLALHLGLVLAFFLVLPYSKMMHAPFRALALLRNAMEKRR
ncbi:tricarballylate utilization 4Fe-4S protein TcuB [Sabulicella glaciei]|uniref:Tricarballylate utilization 4Fe-4S protein TcuB n=1 Tax=Sabulicella glaciei TaxID=2984948 RepID=A0ABT3NQF0_9PROT|nr:tricarballylate utilization 4Fe-4S protein TcuB [Roseococcus sp. MDT2-1-1]MCW8084389.1 tricarballylate utilization 4Fe-4S protein TcuB [Roseococcus sp. MDT2-1-1]